MDAGPRRIGFALAPGYALMSAAAAVEPLRAANLLSGRPLYEARFVSEAGGEVASSAGGSFATVPASGAGDDFDVVFVLAGGDPFGLGLPRLRAWLRRLDARGVALGGISGGAALLALAGLMEGRRFTLHWEHEDSLRSLAGNLLIERRLFVIDRDRYSCAGGVAALDMMLALIAAGQGADFARRVGDWFIHTRIREPEDAQRSSPADRHGARHKATAAALELMESHLADPLTVAQLAALAGVTPRHLLRLFRDELGRGVKQVYSALRLAKVEELARATRLAPDEVARLCGFADQAHVARTRRNLAQIPGHQPFRPLRAPPGRPTVPPQNAATAGDGHD